MRRSATLIFVTWCCLGAGSLSAEIYRTTDADGNVVFTDTPAAGSEAVQLGPASTYSPPSQHLSSPTSAPEEEEAPQDFYTSLRIVQPAAEETLRENAGNVVIQLQIEPELLKAAGHRIQFYLDGDAIGTATEEQLASLSNVDRGEHQVEAAVVDVNGKALIRTEPVRFYLHRYSTLNAPN